MARLSGVNEPQDSSVGSSIASRLTRSSLRSVSNGTTSTAPTSYADYSNASPSASKVDLTTELRHMSRVPHSTSSYNVNTTSESEFCTHSINFRTASASATTTRNVSGVSGETLVNSMNQSQEQLPDQGSCAPDLDGHAEALSEDDDRTGCSGGLKRRRSTRLEGALKDAAYSLANRGRKTLENGKEKIKELKSNNRRDSLRPRQSILDHIELAPQEPLRKKARLDSATLSDPPPLAETGVIKAQPKVKRWQSVGLYVGQERDFRANMSETKNKLRRKSEAMGNVKEENRVLPLPMFAGQRLLESKSHRDFELPFDVYSPLPQRQPKPDEWRKTQSNRFVEDAAAVWKNVKGLAPSKCICTRELGCDEDCHNRTMFYECNESNCAIGASFCSNRAFAELENRKDGQDRGKEFRKYNIGVEVMQTTDRGFGVRANRTFMPNQIIVEYAGEIVTQDECDRRMNEEYKNNECYYLMSFTQNMIIDATRGSIARFVNHSCEPNCRMEMWIVNGKPRMALFAGKRGIMTGEELTYDYNFDPFSRKNVQECRCGTASCRGILGPKTKEDRAKPSKPQEPGTSILAGAKRKLKEILSGTGSSDAEENRRPRAVLKKRKIASVGRSALAQVTRQVSGSRPSEHGLETAEDGEVNVYPKPQRRVLQRRSNASLLPELSDAGGLLSSKPSQNSLSLARHHSSRTSTAITRIASAVKRKASLLNPRSSTRSTSTATTLGLGHHTSFSSSRYSQPNTITRSQARSSQHLNLSTSHSQSSQCYKAPKLPEVDLLPSFLASEYKPSKTKPSTPTTKATTTTTTHDQWSPSSVYPDPETRTVTPGRSASVHSTVASVRKGVVRSVKGPRRAVAMARMGLGAGGVEEAGRSIRLILGDEM